MMNETGAEKGRNEETAEETTVVTLERLRDEACDGSDEKLALVLGRPLEEVQAWFHGDEQIDEDAEMKIRGLAMERLGNG